MSLLSGNPFPGLRPFREDEEHLFFGRESQVDTMVDKLASARFLAVVGASGSGKSSLVNCGLRPALYRGLMARAGTSWWMAQFRPGSNPLRALAHTLTAHTTSFGDLEPQGLSLFEIVGATLRMSSLGLADVYEQVRPGEGTNLLVVVDQFEELFRYRQTGGLSGSTEPDRAQEAVAFVNLLLEARARLDLPIYIVITMRSDFLGDCAQFAGLAEAINEGQYLVPRMTREQRKAAIAGPAGVGGAEIGQVLLNRLVNDVGDNPDQLSILQHALNRTWANWQHDGRGAGPLSLPNYAAIGTMANALDRHAEEAFAELGTEWRQWICQKIFKALTDRGSDARGVRRPSSFATLCAMAGASPAEVASVIGVFREPSRSFLMPSITEEKAPEPDSMIDISHESLMRVWKRLRVWADEEAESARFYRRLSETANLHAAGKAALWRDPDLQFARDWAKQEKPTAAWAGLYGGGFDSAMNFLAESEVQHERERLAAEESRRRELEQARALAAEKAKSLQRLRIGFGITAILAILAGGAAIYAWQESARAKHQKALAGSRGLAAEATNLLRDQLDLALLLAVQASRMVPASEASEAQNSLRKALKNGPVLILHRDRDPVNSVAFSPDGTQLAAGSNNHSIILWDTKGGKRPRILQHEGSVRSVAFSPDGTWLASGSDDHNIILWDTKSSARLRILEGHTETVNSVAFSPSAALLASGSNDDTIILWSTDSGKPLQTLKGHAGSVNSLAFSPDGKLLASGSDDYTIILWDAKRGKRLRTFQGHKDLVNSVAFSPDGTRLASGSNDNTIILWDAKRGNRLRTLEGHKGVVNSVAFSPDGARLGSGSDDNTTILWDATSGEQLRTFEGHKGVVNSVAFSPDSARLASGSDDHKVILWNTALHTPDIDEDSVSSVAFSPSGTRLASGRYDDSKIILWNANSGKFLQSLEGHDQSVRSVAFNRDGTILASGGFDHKVILWDVNSGKLLRTLLGHKEEVSSLAFSPDGKILASGSFDHRIILWDANHGKALDTLEGHKEAVLCVAFNHDGTRLASGSSDQKIVVWDANRGKPLQVLAGHKGAVNTVAFSHDGALLASGSDDKTIILWDARTGRPLRTLEGHIEPVRSVAFSPDGDRPASGSEDNTIILWDVNGGKPLQTLKKHAGDVSSVAFSPDGKRLASGSDDHTIILWDAKTGNILQTLEIDPFDLAAAQKTACGIANRDMTRKEWDGFVGDDPPYRATCPGLPLGEGAPAK